MTLRNAILVHLLALAFVVGGVENTWSETLLFHASASGHQTMDEGEGGGNPFASALIEILLKDEVRLADFPESLRELTVKKSSGFQTPDVPKNVSGGHWTLMPSRSGEKRIALVLVVSNYERAGAISLPGAAHDSHRMTSALTKAGFKTELALDLDLKGMRKKLAEFGAASSSYDVAAIYTTGHGVERDGVIYLVPGAFPISEGDAALPSNALPLRDIAASPRARAMNLVFYGGCRDNPFSN
ncbi:MAG: caspase family protein [Rhodomicrobium sp.]